MTTNALMELADRLARVSGLTREDCVELGNICDGLRTAASGVGEPAAWLCEWLCPYSDETARVTFEHKRGADSRAEEVGLMLGVEARVLPLYLHPGAEARDAEPVDWRGLWAIERTMRLMDCGLSKQSATSAMQQEERAYVDAALRARESG